MGKEAMKQIIADYFKTQPVLRAWLFGSYARGEETEESDVDILVDYDPSMPTMERGESLLNLQIALEDEIHRDVDIVTAYTLKNPYFIEELNQTKYHIYGHAN